MIIYLDGMQSLLTKFEKDIEQFHLKMKILTLFKIASSCVKSKLLKIFDLLFLLV